MGDRLNGWLSLRRKKAADRQVAILVYGFPPNVGATGTAALLDVPSSLDNLLDRLKEEGYNLGESNANGETLIAALAAITQEAALARGADALPRVLEAATRGDGSIAARVDNSTGGLGDAKVIAADVDGTTLKSWIGKELSSRLETQWGDLRSYRGIATQSDGKLVCCGLQLGNVFIGVQPLLGIEGDPMRMMFERDLTPHPQYCALYEWLWQPPAAHGADVEGVNGVGADAVIHLGMHGTVEWLPGSPLGGTATSWPDRLLGSAPNVYLYAANNPSESILAKRRGYGTLVSYMTPPYARAGLYLELARTRELLSEYRADPVAEYGLRPTIADALISAGLDADLPPSDGLLSPSVLEDTVDSASRTVLDGERVLTIATAFEAAGDSTARDEWVRLWDAYLLSAYDYLSVLEERLFSEGLHVFGRKPSSEQVYSYLEAYFGEEEGEGAEEGVLRAVSEMGGKEGVEEVAKDLLHKGYGWAAAAAKRGTVSGATLDALSGERLEVPVEEEDGEWMAAIGRKLLRPFAPKVR